MEEEKVLKFKNAVGQLIKEIRQSRTDLSINKLAYEYDFAKSNISNIEKGVYGLKLITAWRICEALDIKFSEFAKLLEKKLGSDYTLIDE